ncbi:hypothetical protein DB42_EA00870 [Neochlamydia sp. EPS4]|nr:hypothetical protein DB42_EA00870 [Neochlamydia sp. EPS4]
MRHVLDLPMAYKRGEEQKFKGRTLGISIEAYILEHLKLS